MAAHLRASLVLVAFEMALMQRQPERVIHHSDRGPVYLLHLCSRCRKAGVRPSVGSVGDAYDNAMWESYFATLECELDKRRSFQTQREARPEVFHLIEGWYNLHRRHLSLGYMSPLSLEAQAHQAEIAWSPTQAERGCRSADNVPVRTLRSH